VELQGSGGSNFVCKTAVLFHFHELGFSGLFVFHCTSFFEWGFEELGEASF
jgi:hypothetical protein